MFHVNFRTTATVTVERKKQNSTGLLVGLLTTKIGVYKPQPE